MWARAWGSRAKSGAVQVACAISVLFVRGPFRRAPYAFSLMFDPTFPHLALNYLFPNGGFCVGEFLEIKIGFYGRNIHQLRRSSAVIEFRI